MAVGRPVTAPRLRDALSVLAREGGDRTMVILSLHDVATADDEGEHYRERTDCSRPTHFFRDFFGDKYFSLLLFLGGLECGFVIDGTAGYICCFLVLNYWINLYYLLSFLFVFTHSLFRWKGYLLSAVSVVFQI